MGLVTSDRSEQVLSTADLGSDGGQHRFAYRPALDGLRAIAVYLVVGFHSGWYRLEGGFVGVDLFFVLSGFLITSVLVAKQESTGKIELARFYSRRVRRLLPAALATVVGASLVFTLVFSEVARTSWVRDGQSALLYVSNWFFIGEATDYFAEAVGQSPFLHFWSLSIEEQFYLGFPLLLIAILKLSRIHHRVKPLVSILVLTLLSLASQVLWATHDPTRAYYGTDTRLYQIAAGATVAMSLFSIRKRRQLHAVPGLGAIALLALIAISTNSVQLSPSNRGIAATIVAAGLILSLETNPNGLLSRCLSISPAVYLGRVSYGTYLWHWPVILVISAILRLGALEIFVISAFVATAVATLSYHLFETPIRESAWLSARPRTVVGAGIIASVVAAVIIVPVILQNDRKPADLARAATPTITGQVTDVAFDPNAPVPANFDRGGNHGVSGTPSRDNMHCEHGSSDDCLVHPGNGPHVMLVGDSHAGRLAPVFLQLAREHDFRFSMSAVASCRWQVGLAPEDRREDDCYSMRDDLYNRLLGEVKPDLIVTVSVGLSPVGVRDPSLESLNLTELITQVTRTSLDEMLIHAKEVLILEPLPLAGFDVKSCLSGARVIGECMFSYGEGRSDSRSESETYAHVYRTIASADPKVTSAPYDSLICPAGSPCYPVENGFATMDDYHHVNTVHAVENRDRVWGILEPILIRLADR